MKSTTWASGTISGSIWPSSAALEGLPYPAEAISATSATIEHTAPNVKRMHAARCPWGFCAHWHNLRQPSQCPSLDYTQRMRVNQPKVVQLDAGLATFYFDVKTYCNVLWRHFMYRSATAPIRANYIKPMQAYVHENNDYAAMNLVRWLMLHTDAHRKTTCRP